MEKITEAISIVEGIYPQTGTAISSSVLFDMKNANRFCAVVSHGTATTVSTLNVQIWANETNVWSGASLVSQQTVTVATGSSNVTSLEVDADSIGNDHRFIGIHVTKTNTVPPVGAVALRNELRYK